MMKEYACRRSSGGSNVDSHTNTDEPHTSCSWDFFTELLLGREDDIDDLHV